MFVKEDKWSQFGHYIVDGNDPIYHIKLALERKRASNCNVQFKFHDELFTAINALGEPKQDLLDLYVQRVHQLRNKYDHLVLMYSGGADSHNILKCFEYADVKLDEIVSFVDSSYKSKDSKVSSEIYQVAIPEVKQYQEKYPECKYRLLEIRDVQTKLFNDPEFKFDLYKDLAYQITPVSILHNHGLHYIQEYHDMNAAGKRVGVIQGIEKPRLECVDNRWSFYFNDWSSWFGQKHYFRDFATYDEFFYWTPELPEIPIKQAHVAARYFDYLDSQGTQYTYRDNEMANVVKRRSGSRTNWEYANHVIYPFWKTGTYSVGKTFESYIVNARDDSLARLSDELIITYKKAVVKTLMLAKQTGHHATPKILGNFADDKTVIGLKPMRSIRHFIE